MARCAGRYARLAVWYAAFWLLAALAPLSALAAPFAALVMDARTGEVLHAQNADARLHPASLTKMMTLYVTFDAIRRGEISLDTMVTISAKAAAEPPSRLGLRTGQRISLRNLIRAAAIKSANDAATAIGEAVSGSEAAFARRMTAAARAIGMRNSTFKNAHGLTESGHLSTARDMTILGRRLFYDFPDYYPLFSRTTIDAGVTQVANTNRRFLENYRGADGIKTGFTNAAGFNLTASAERGGKRLVATVFGGTSTAQRNARMAELLDRGFGAAPANVATRRPAPVDLPRGGDAPAVADAAGTVPVASAKTIRLVTAPARSPRPMARPGAAPAELPFALVAEAPEAAPSAADDAVQAAIDAELRDALASGGAAAPRPRPAPAEMPASDPVSDAVTQAIAAASDTASTPEPTDPEPAEAVAAAPDPAVTDPAPSPLPAAAPEAPTDAPVETAIAAADTAPVEPAPPAPAAAAPAAVAAAVADPAADEAAEAPAALAALAPLTLPDMPAPVADEDPDLPADMTADLRVEPSDDPGALPAAVAPVAPPAPRGPGIVMTASALAPATAPAAAQAGAAEVVARVSTSGRRHWGVSLGRFPSRGTAERALLQTGLAEARMLGAALRKVVPRSGGYEANFGGLTRDEADLACRRLAARGTACTTLGP